MESVGLNPDFWRGKRVTITGHTGFKGAWLTLFLRALGARVSGVSLEVMPGSSLFSVAETSDGIDSRLLDIRDYAALAIALRETEPEVVLHLAAQSLVRLSYQLPVETYATNVMGTVNMLEAVRGTPSVRAVVNVTSDKCYENREVSRGYTEQDEMGGYDPYSNSKGCAELVTSAYRRSFFSGLALPVGVSSARAGNVIGGGDWAKDRLVVDTVRAFVIGDPVMLRNPSAIRPWQHVFEPLRGYLLLAQRLCADPLRFSEPWNFGPDEQDMLPVQSVVAKLAALWGPSARWETNVGLHAHEAQTLRLDCTKARNVLGWSPVWTLDRGLAETVSWYRSNAEGKDMSKFSRQQVDAYLQESAHA